MSNEQDEIIQEFLIEAFESLDQLDQDFVALESNPTDTDILNKIFRAIHTIKGTCGFLGLQTLEAVAHIGESLLDELRSGRISVTPDIATALLEMVDAIRAILTKIETTGAEGQDSFGPLRGRLQALKDGEALSDELGGEACTNSQVEHDPKEGQREECSIETSVDELSENIDESSSAPANGEGGSSEQPSEDTANHDLIAEILASPDFQQEEPVAEQEMMGAVMEASSSAEEIPPSAELPQEEVSSSASADAAEDKESAPQAARASVTESSLRVDVGLLDKVMNLVGELVLARNQILQFTKNETDTALLGTCQRLNLITSELQEGVMKTRMQPIANVWNKFPRVVRDVARSCGKDIRVEMEGKDTELDKTILEAIKDPLTHIVRNSADHGIESPEMREKAGKNRQGLLQLRAFHEGGHVIIEIADDGAGLNIERIRTKAVEKGIYSHEKASRLSEAEVQRLIFHPGFSTAEKVTNVSGRGVGMDVVRSNIEKIGGSVDIQSQEGAGTTLKIKIPLTLAIVPALIISCQEQRFAIPQVSLIELLRVEHGSGNSGLEEIRGALFYRLRGNLLPLVDLRRELGMKQEDIQEEERHTALNIVVVRAENKDFGLIVESVHDTEEIVVKPLGRQVKNIPVFAGATIMGDGKVALILDILGLGREAGIVHEGRETQDGFDEQEDGEETSEKQSLLLVRSGTTSQLGIPIGRVDRLEEFSREVVEYASGHEVVQYRDGILPLLNLPRFFGNEHFSTNTYSVVVCTVDGQQVGLIVESILDILEDSLDLHDAHARRGISGSAVVQGKVTDILDVATILQSEFEGSLESSISRGMEA